MDKIEEYMKNYLPRVTRLSDGSGRYEVASPAVGHIAYIGRAGVSILKDKLLLEGLKLNIRTEVAETDTSNIKSGSD